VKLREIAKKIFFKSLSEVLPENIISSSVKFSKGILQIDETSVDLHCFRKVYLLGCGKASLRMARSMEEILRERIDGGIVVTNYADFPLETIEVLEASHPLPDMRSLRAARRIKEILRKLSEEDFFIFLLSGGASALMEEPIEPISIGEVALLNQLLLKSGADIYEINCVRKHVSSIKGGKLARATRARGLVLVISDVVGDDLEVIGSGPFYCDRTTFKDAYEVIKKYGLLEKIPDTIKKVIQQGIEGKIPETPKSPPDNVKHLIIGNNLRALREAKLQAEKFGFRAVILTSMLEGEAKEVAKLVVSIAKEVKASGNPVLPPACLLLGGETTVKVRGSGKGGRNQEFCLSALKSLRDFKDICILSAGTDGIDGNTDVAGAVVDAQSLDKAKGLDVDEFLNNNDSYSFFQRVGGLIKTGPTGTNVMDIIIAIVGG